MGPWNEARREDNRFEQLSAPSRLGKNPADVGRCMGRCSRWAWKVRTRRHGVDNGVFLALCQRSDSLFSGT